MAKQRAVRPSQDLTRGLPRDVRAQMASNRALTALVAAVRAGGGIAASPEATAKRAGLVAHEALPVLASTFRGRRTEVVHIPFAVGARGRVSLLKLRKGQTTIAGLYVARGGVFTRHVTRKTGAGALAAGDRLDEQIVDARGRTVQRLSYTVRAVERATGSMHLSNAATGRPKTGDIVNGGRGWCWFCNAGSRWWCGFPCLPLPAPEDDLPIVV